MAASKKKKIIIIVTSIVLTLAILFTLLYFGIGLFFYDFALNPKSKLFEMDFDWEIDESHDKTDWLKHEVGGYRVSAQSNDGLELSAQRVGQKDFTDKWVVLVHGYRSDGYSMNNHAFNFYQAGYNLLIPDLRGLGESEGEYIGMGWHDRLDIIKWIDYIVSQDKSSQIVLLGVSMGAATVMMTTGEILPSNVKAAIEDCGYDSVYNQFEYVLTNVINLPKWPIMSAAETIAKIKAGYDFKDASAVEQVKKSITPTLFIHGKEDDFVPFFMLENVYQNAACEKEKLEVPNAGHALSAYTNPTLYWESVYNFLDRYLV